MFWKKIKTSSIIHKQPIISKWLERNGIKDIWACLDGCFKGKCWYILEVISFLYIHVILTFGQS